MTRKNKSSSDNIHSKYDNLSCSLTSENIKRIFSASDDIVFRAFFIKNQKDLGITVIFIDGMANPKIINDNIMYPLSTSSWYDNCTSLGQAFNLSLNGALDISGITSTQKVAEAINALLVGKTLLMFDEIRSALILDTISFDRRSITSSTEEATYRSGKDSFVETLRANTATLRKKIKSHHLCIEETVVGKQSHTPIAIAYMKNICNDSFIKKVKESIANINQDKAMSIRDIYTNVIKEKFTPFPTAITTEKPDVCCMSLLEGKVAVIMDELPYALLFPAVFGDFFKSTCDYSFNFLISSLFRLLRYGCFFLSILLPGFFIAIESFHPDLIPYKLAVSIAASRMGTPFSVQIEVLSMTFAFFILIQASLQISNTIGSAISIVGGLVLGEAAITAGFVSPSVIVVVATAAICSMAIPNKEVNSAIWLFQIIGVLLSALFGLMGFVITLLILIFALAKLEPLGVPYLSPYTNSGPLQLDDSFIRFPNSFIKKRPQYLKPKNKQRKR